MKNKTYLCYWFFFVLFLSLFCLGKIKAQDFTKAPKAEVMKVLQKLSEEAQTLQSPFVQEKHMSFLTEPLLSEGQFVFAQPDKLRWAYTKPYIYTIVFNGKTISINDGSQTTAFNIQENPLFAEVNEMMLGLVQGKLIAQSQQFDVQYLQNSKIYKLIFTPRKKEMRDMLSSIEMIIDKTDGTAQTIRMNEQNDDFTLIKFKAYKINEKLPEGTFSL